MIVAAEDDPDLAVDIKPRSPVRIGATRGLCKLLEISDRDKLGLLTDGRVIFGLGHVEASYDPAAIDWKPRISDVGLKAVDSRSRGAR